MMFFTKFDNCVSHKEDFIVDAIVLAGGSGESLGKDICPYEFRALTPICGKPMVSYVTDALLDSGKIDRVLVVGDVPHLTEIFSGDKYSDKLEILQSGGNMLENTMIAIANTHGLALIATMDIPLINGETVRAFIEQCEAHPDHEFYYPIIEQSVNETAYPTAKRTYFRLAEGKYTGGNIIMMDAAMAIRNKEKLESLITHRKSAVKMAFDVGLLTLIKMVVGKLPLSEVEYKVCKSFDIKGKAIISYSPEIGLDIDKPSDWQTATNLLSSIKQ